MVSRHRFDVATWFCLHYRNWCRDPIFEVATWVVLVRQKGGRDMGLTLRPGLVVQEVATWERCRDLAWGRLPGRVATNTRPACARPAMAARATCTRPAMAARVTCARQACCERSSAHDMGTARAVCARPGFWVCALCTQPSFVTVHCLRSLF